MFEVKCVVVNSKVTEDFVCDFREGISNDMLLLPNSYFKVKIDGEIKVFPPHTAFYFPKYTPFYYTRTEGDYIDYFIHFTQTDNSVTSPSLPVGRPIYLTDPKKIYKLIEIIAVENFFEHKNRTEILDNLMKTLFLMIGEPTRSESAKPHFSELYDLRVRIYLHPELNWNLEQVAESLFMSQNNVHRLYKEYFNTTIINDVINSRIRQAKEYLAHTNYSISTIADYCGYNNTEHFCRQFKTNIGVTPKEYRHQFQD